jgi:hypothetical protein
MFFCSIKLDSFICTPLCCLLGVLGGRGLIYSKCHTLYIHFILRTFWSFFIIAKRFVSYVCMFSSNSVLFFELTVSVVDCRQSGCSHNVESSFVEERRTCTSVRYHDNTRWYKFVPYTTFSFGF